MGKINKTESLKEKREYLLFNKVPLFIIDFFPDHIDINYIIKRIEKNIPPSFLVNIDAIYVGEFEELNNREIQAMYKDSAIYLSSFKNSNIPVSEELIVVDIVHEIGHSFEEKVMYELYHDKKLENEFISKRKRLFEILKSEEYKISEDLFLNPEYDEKFDLFLYKKIGYEKLSLLTVGLFTSPYSATSLREYFANGFEEFYLGDKKYLMEICPTLFKKIKLISNIEEV